MGCEDKPETRLKLHIAKLMEENTKLVQEKTKLARENSAVRQRLKELPANLKRLIHNEMEKTVQLQCIGTSSTGSFEPCAKDSSKHLELRSSDLFLMKKKTSKK